MDPKSELLVFSRKEIFFIIVLLVLVALFSFTLGLKLGKSLGSGEVAVQEEAAPLSEKAELTKTKAPQDAQPVTRILDDHKANDAHANGIGSPQVAEDVADAELAKEAEKEKLANRKPVPMSLPDDKKGDTSADAKKIDVSAANLAGRFTLQVGSHRTVSEAADQVSVLKRKDLEAFYVEANVPGKGTWYRVGVGVFPTKELAEAAAEKMKRSKQLPQFIVQKITE